MLIRSLCPCLIVVVTAVAAVPNQYIVEMAGEPVAVHISRHAPGAGIRSQAALLRRAQIREEQRPVRARLEASEAHVVDSLDTVANALIVNISDEKAARLQSVPGVVHVYPVRRFKLSLDHALPLHHVPEAWQQVGLANAGAGIKIAMIDTGIDIQHPGFQDPSLAVPSGFPRVNADSDTAFTNNKVIVARSYTNLLEKPDTDNSARDRVGHGTATAMAAAGVMNTGPAGTISGIAPKAWLGSYKVFGTPGVNDSATDASLLKALDDAVADGMDIINLSLGSIVATRPQDDIEAQSIERASGLGVIVVVVAGNDGPNAETIDSPGTAPSAITVGAAKNDRQFAGSATVSGSSPDVAIPGTGANSRTPITAPLVPVATLDQSGLACDSLPAGSLTGRVAFILRGVCDFEVKLDNVQQAGAVAALVYADPQQQDPFIMGVGAATLPASMIANSDGVQVLQQLTLNPALTVTLSYALTPAPVSTDGIVSFSSQGPSGDLSLKPDLVAVGVNFYTAAQKFDPKGVLYSATGYTVTQGTSFSSPLVAGAAALLKAARPGLTTAQYKSMLVNTASPAPGSLAQSGAGILNMFNAVNAVAAVAPVAVDFFVGDGNPTVARTLTVSNVGAVSTTFVLSVVPQNGGPAPQLTPASLDLAPGQAARINVNLTATALPPGQYQGSILVADTSTGLTIKAPYWYAVRSNVPSQITVLLVSTGDGRGLQVENAVLFRVTDTSGIALTNIQPVATIASGPGTVTSVDSQDSVIPGSYSVTIRGLQASMKTVVTVQAGDVSMNVTIPSS
jgi:minor extracellular serine protease Vpr